jgi:hypothetical protein
MNPELLRWMNSVQPVLACHATTSVAYSEAQGNLSHYHAVAERLLVAFDDIDLARAAFLHGVDSAAFDILDALPGVTPAIRVILNERNRMRSMIGGSASPTASIQDEGADLAHLVATNVLPRLTDARSIILFVQEQLDHVDPQQILSDWTMAFARQPVPLVFPVPDPKDVRRDRHHDVRSRAMLLRHVVATAAQYVGLWHATVVARNAALFLENQRQFNRIVNAVIADAALPNGLSRTRERYVSNILCDESVVIRWEWLNVADLDKELGSNWSDATKIKRFERAGFVAIECPDTDRCYEILRRLHTTSFQPNEIRDFIGAPRKSGYSALHTVLVRGGSSSSRRDLHESIPVHVLTSKTAERQRDALGVQHLERARTFLSAAASGVLRTFAPDGKAIDLGPGATVLNFAAKIHSHIVLRLRGATVNRKPVPLTHRLEDGDIVWLDIGDLPQPLPAGWEEYLGRDTRRKIWRAHRPNLETAGREWLRRRLVEQGVTVSIEDDQLDSVVEQAEGDLHENRHGARWVLRRLGMFAMTEDGVDVGVHPVDAATAYTYVKVVKASMATLISYKELDLPPAMRGKFDDVVKCDQCRPLNDDEFDASLSNRRLTIHRRDGTCPGSRFPVRSIIRQTQNQFFVIETSNRTGVAAKVLAVFQKHGVDLCDLAARRVGVTSAVIRVGVDILGVMRRQAIVRDLNNIADVVRVVGPGERKSSFVEYYLPPRPTGPTPLWSRGAPFQPGWPVDDERRFYGMDRELEKLHTAFEAILSPKTGGRFAYVYAPLKVGKTSLVYAFLRRRETDTLNRSLAHYHNPKRGVGWAATAEAIRTELLALAASDGVTVSPEWTTLQSALVGIRRQIRRPVILVIDEIIGLLRSSTSESDIASFLNLYNEVTTTPGILVILVGPSSTVTRVNPINPRLMKVLQDCLPIEVGPLAPGAVAAHLRAEKFGPAYQIGCSMPLVHEVCRLTGGNPFWITTLAALMYDCAVEKHGSNVITFSHQLLNKAKQKMFEQQRPFADRVDSPHDAAAPPEHRELKREILKQFVTRGREPMAPVDLHRLVIRKRSVASADFEAALDELRATGTLAYSGDLPSIGVQPPILADFLRYFIASQESSIDE